MQLPTSGVQNKFPIKYYRVCASCRARTKTMYRWSGTMTLTLYP